MEKENDIRIIGMLGDVNNKINDIGLIMKDMQDRMNMNFRLLAESQLTTNDKLNNISESIDEIKFKVGVLESGVGLNATRIGELSSNK